MRRLTSVSALIGKAIDGKRRDFERTLHRLAPVALGSRYLQQRLLFPYCNDHGNRITRWKRLLQSPIQAELELLLRIRVAWSIMAAVKVTSPRASARLRQGTCC
jgi:hypothetical protein